MRPDPNTYKCPDGSNPCSDTLSPKNVICVSDTSECPIIDILFVSSEDLQPYIDNANYTVLEYLPTIPGRPAVSLVYTKTEVDSLPITTTQISQFPCLDPSEMWQQDLSEYYVLEKDKNVTTCQDPPHYSQSKYDTRYTANVVTSVSTQLNEWEIQ